MTEEVFVSQLRCFKTTDLVPVLHLHMGIPSSLHLLLCNGSFTVCIALGFPWFCFSHGFYKQHVTYSLPGLVGVIA